MKVAKDTPRRTFESSSRETGSLVDRSVESDWYEDTCYRLGSTESDILDDLLSRGGKV
jgi:hypothetical protein